MHLLENKMLMCLVCPLSWILLANFVLSQNITAFYGNNMAKPGCPSSCGNVTIPFPFGIGSNCSLNSGFLVSCDTTNGIASVVSGSKIHRLFNILESSIRVRSDRIAIRCPSRETSPITLDYSNTPYSLSEANQLRVLGCSELAVLEVISRQYPAPNRTKSNYANGCVSICPEGDRSRNDSCSGNGCCQMSVPKGTVVLNATVGEMNTQVGNRYVNVCGVAYLGEQIDYTSFAVSVSGIYSATLQWFMNSSLVLTLDWRIGTDKCLNASSDSSSYACQDNSECFDAEAGVGGYRCKCNIGYEGNPYLHPGCTDIDECANRNGSDICGPNSICTNTIGRYECNCAPGYSIDAGYCYPILEPKLTRLAIGLISGSGFIALISVSFGLTRLVKKKKSQNQRQKFFKRNGGLLLQQETSTNEGIMRKTRIFTAKELEKATDHFNASRILGQGGQGTVYKGMLSNGQIVAIKKSKLVDENKSKVLVEQFINEVVILSQISHRNVVRLLGCCLETRIPLLVYEFMPNGTLSSLIHDKNIEFPISWTIRLIIAADIASALSYLHYATGEIAFLVP